MQFVWFNDIVKITRNDATYFGKVEIIRETSVSVRVQYILKNGNKLSGERGLTKFNLMGDIKIIHSEERSLSRGIQELKWMKSLVLNYIDMALQTKDKEWLEELTQYL